MVENGLWGKNSPFLSVGMNDLTVKSNCAQNVFNCWLKELPYIIELRNSLNLRYYVIVRICTVKVNGLSQKEEYGIVKL